MSDPPVTIQYPLRIDREDDTRAEVVDADGRCVMTLAQRFTAPPWVSASALVGYFNDRRVSRLALEGLLRLLAGDPRPCRKCGRPIWLLTNPATGEKMPFTDEGLSHFADCPGAADFRKGKPGEGGAP